MDLIETVVDSRPIYDGKIIQLSVNTVELPNGVHSTREIVTHRGAVCVVPLQQDGSVIMVRQFRLTAGRPLLEVPAGGLHENEDPADCAARELEEETGFKPGNLRKLFTAFLSPGYSTEQIHAYLAEGLTPGTVHLDEAENVETVIVPGGEIVAMILDGEIVDAKSIAALLMALQLNPPSPF